MLNGLLTPRTARAPISLVRLVARWLGLLLFALAGSGLTRAETPAPPTIVFFGDSLTFGYGLDDPGAEAYPALIQARIAEAKLNYRVVNAGLSGETTAGGLRRVDWILRQPVDIFVLALGGNDGLRGISPAISAENLKAIVGKVRAKYPAARIVLAGMMMPASMGEDYAKEFAAMYPKLAREEKLTLIPFLLENVAGREDLNQADRIHPTAAGHAIVAENVWQILRPLL